MKAILSIVRKEFLQLRRDPRLFPVLFISPILQLLLLGYAANLDVRDIPSVVCDLDRTAASRDFLDGFVNSGYFTVRARVGRMEDIDRFLDNGDAAMAFVVPRGFGDKLAGGKQASVMIIADGSESQSATIGVNYANDDRRALHPAHRPREVRADQGDGGEAGPWSMPRSGSGTTPSSAAGTSWSRASSGLILMIMTISLASMGIVREKEAGTMEQLIVTPIRPHQLIVGKLLPFVLIGLVEADLRRRPSRNGGSSCRSGAACLLLFALSLAFMLNTLGIGLFISTISRTQQQAMFTTVFFIMPMMLLGGFVFPIENMPPFFQAVSHIVPTRYFFVIIRGIMLRGAGWAELWDQAASLLAAGSVALRPERPPLPQEARLTAPRQQAFPKSRTLSAC